MIKPGVVVQALSPMCFDSDGNLTDDDTRELLRRHLEEFTKWTLRIVAPHEFVKYYCEVDIQRTAA